MTTIGKVGPRMSMPKVGQQVVLHYNRRLVAYGAAPHHGKVVAVVARKTRGRPRNHLVQLDDGQLVVVPCGQLRRPICG